MLEAGGRAGLEVLRTGNLFLSPHPAATLGRDEPVPHYGVETNMVEVCMSQS